MGNVFEKLESVATDTVARFSPWLSPLPTAYLTGRATIVHLHWPDALGFLAGIIVEFLGLASVNTSLELYNYNRSRRKSDPAAPLWIAVSLSMVYFGAVTGLTVFLDTMPEWAILAPLVFPLLSMSGITILALRADHRRRLAAVAADRSERRSGRGHVTGQNGGQVTGQGRGQDAGQMAGDVTGQGGQFRDPDRANQVRKQNRDEALTSLLTYLEANPMASYSEIGMAVGRSKPWAIAETNKLTAAGKLHRNGQGWEVR